MRSIFMNTVAPLSIMLHMANTDQGTGKPRNRRAPRAPTIEATTFHTHSELEGWTLGQELDGDDHVEYLRDLYNAGAEGGDTEMTDDEIKDVIRAINGDSAEAETLRIDMIAERTEGEADDEATPDVSAVRSAGFGYGARLDEMATNHFVQIADSKEFLDGSPLLVALDIERLFIKTNEETGELIEDETAAWPMPGSSYDDDDRSPDWKGQRSNLQPDHYKDGKTRGSFYADFVDGSAYGKTIAAIRQCFAKVKSNERLNDIEAKLLRDVAGIPNWNTLHDVKIRETEDSRWSSRRTNVILRVRRGMTFLRKRDEVMEVAGVTVQFVNEDMGHVLKKREPIYIAWDNELKGKARKTFSSSPMALTKFNRLLVHDTFGEKPKKGVLTLVKEGMPTIAAFEKTVERPARRKGSKAEGLTIPTSNVNGKQAFVMVAGLKSFFEDVRKDPGKGLVLAAELAGPNARSDVKSFGETLDEMNTFFEPYRSSFLIIQQQDLEQKQKETAERLAATGTAKK